MRKKAIFELILALFLTLSVCGCSGKQPDNADYKGSGEPKKTMEDYRESRVGIATGTYAATFMYDMFPDAEIIEFNTIPDLMLALTQGKIDICANDASYYSCMRWDGMNVGRLEEQIETGD